MYYEHCCLPSFLFCLIDSIKRLISELFVLQGSHGQQHNPGFPLIVSLAGNNSYTLTSFSAAPTRSWSPSSLWSCNSLSGSRAANPSKLFSEAFHNGVIKKRIVAVWELLLRCTLSQHHSFLPDRCTFILDPSLSLSWRVWLGHCTKPCRTVRAGTLVN